MYILTLHIFLTCAQDFDQMVDELWANCLLYLCISVISQYCNSGSFNGRAGDKVHTDNLLTLPLRLYFCSVSIFVYFYQSSEICMYVYPLLSDTEE